MMGSCNLKYPRKRIVCVWFTFKDDGEQCLTSLAFAQKAFGEDSAYYFAEDGAAPLELAARQKLEAHGATVLTTRWNRRGNIKGDAHLRGATQLYFELAMAHDADVIVKLDSDTALLSRKWVDALLWRDGGAIFAGAFGARPDYAYGLAYAIKGINTLEKLYHDCAAYPAYDYALEDFEIGHRLARIAGESPCDKSAKWAKRHSLGLYDNDFMLVDAGRRNCAPWNVDGLVKCQVVSVGYNLTYSSESAKEKHRAAQSQLLRDLWVARFGETKE